MVFAKIKTSADGLQIEESMPEELRDHLDSEGWEKIRADMGGHLASRKATSEKLSRVWSGLLIVPCFLLAFMLLCFVVQPFSDEKTSFLIGLAVGVPASIMWGFAYLFMRFWQRRSIRLCRDRMDTTCAEFSAGYPELNFALKQDKLGTKVWRTPQIRASIVKVSTDPEGCEAEDQTGEDGSADILDNDLVAPPGVQSAPGCKLGTAPEATPSANPGSKFGFSPGAASGTSGPGAKFREAAGPGDDFKELREEEHQDSI